MFSDEELFLISSPSSSSCEDVWEGEGEDSLSLKVHLPLRKVRKHCKVVRWQGRNWNKEEAQREDLEDELERERRLVLDLDTRLLQMETEKMDLLHQLKVAKQMGSNLESHLIFLEEQLAAQLVDSHQKQMGSSSVVRLIRMKEQLVNFDQETLNALNHEKQPLNNNRTESNSRDVVKCRERGTQTKSTQTELDEEEYQQPLDFMKDDLPNKILIDRRTKQFFGNLTKQLGFSSLQILLQEFLVHLTEQ